MLIVWCSLTLCTHCKDTAKTVAVAEIWWRWSPQRQRRRDVVCSGCASRRIDDHRSRPSIVVSQESQKCQQLCRGSHQLALYCLLRRGVFQNSHTLRVSTDGELTDVAAITPNTHTQKQSPRISYRHRLHIGTTSLHSVPSSASCASYVPSDIVVVCCCAALLLLLLLLVDGCSSL